MESMNGIAYESHTASDKHGLGFDVEVAARNVHDSAARDDLYNQVTNRLKQIQFVVMDSAYTTPWISLNVLEDRKIHVLPYVRYTGKKE